MNQVQEIKVEREEIEKELKKVLIKILFEVYFLQKIRFVVI